MYKITRPIMTAAELDEHKVTEYGRNYAESDDGWGDMTAEEERGWHVVPAWGRDGWDLGHWPYVAIYFRDTFRETAGKWELMQIVEGDRTVYSFDSKVDREAATDYLFLWYAADQHWAPITYDQRDALNMGYPLSIPDKFRGPYGA